MDRRTYLCLAGIACGASALGLGGAAVLGGSAVPHPQWSGARCPIDGFSDGDLAPYDRVGDRGAIDVDEGTLRLLGTTHAVSLSPETRLARYPGPGTTFGCWALAEPGAKELELTYGVQGLEDRYRAIVDLANDEVELRRRVRGRFGAARRAGVERSLAADTWYRIQVEWPREGPHRLRLFDANEDRLASLEADLAAIYRPLGLGGYGYAATVPSGAARFGASAIDAYADLRNDVVETFETFPTGDDATAYRLVSAPGSVRPVSSPTFDGSSALGFQSSAVPEMDGLAFYGSGRRGLSTSGETVTGWTDHSDTEADLRLTATGNPTLSRTSNGTPAVHFAGGEEQRLHGPEVVAGDSDRTVVSVAAYRSGGSGVEDGSNGGSLCGATAEDWIDSTDVFDVRDWYVASSSSDSPPAVDRGWVVQSSVTNAGRTRTYLDGEEIALRPDAVDPAGGRFAIGPPATGTPSVDVQVAAVLVYDRALDPEIRRRVESHLRGVYLEGVATTPKPFRRTGRPGEPRAGDSFGAAVLAGGTDVDWIELSYGVQDHERRYAARIDFARDRVSLRRYGGSDPQGTTTPTATGTGTNTNDGTRTVTRTDTRDDSGTVGGTVTATGTTPDPTATATNAHQPASAAGTQLAAVSTSVPLAVDTWYEVDVDWGSDGRHAVTLGGEEVLAAVTASDATWSAGGIGYDADVFGGDVAVVDHVTRDRDDC